MEIIKQYWMVFLFLGLGILFLTTKKPLSRAAGYSQLSPKTKKEMNERKIAEAIGFFMVVQGVAIGVSMWSSNHLDYEIAKPIIQKISIISFFSSFAFLIVLFQNNNLKIKKFKYRK